MAHSPENLQIVPLSAISGSGSDSIQHEGFLRTADTAATVEGAGYLNASASRMIKGTIIRAVMAVGGTPVHKNYVVTSASGAATVVIALQATTAG